MTLLAWSEQLPDWQRDALRRIAVSERLTDADRDAIRARLKHAHGIAVEDDTACTHLAEADLPAAADGGEPTLLCGVGPVRHVDRLAGDQELRFGVNGITLVYGDNGTGKSGYARIAKKLCLARVVDELRGDVFAEQAAPPAEVRIRYRLPGEAEASTEDWRDGEPRPAALARVMVLDWADAALDVLQAGIANAVAAAEAAATSAERRFAAEPVRQTGQGAWERMYTFARQGVDANPLSFC